jgi:hypothetical protein
MIDFLLLLGCALTGLFRSRARLEAEILVLRQRINVLRRKSPKRPAFSNIDHLLLVWLSQLVPTTLEALTVVRPETVIRWHRAGFRAYWRFRSRPRGGQPKMHFLPRMMRWDLITLSGAVLVGNLSAIEVSQSLNTAFLSCQAHLTKLRYEASATITFNGNLLAIRGIGGFAVA